jgi:thiol-disulfide isomerase/thioredoxin
MMRRLIAAVPGVLLLGLTFLVAGCGSGPTAPSTTGFTVFAEADRKPAPHLTGELLAGGSWDLAGHAGDVVVVNFWASWCAPCVSEAPDFEATYQATRGNKVSFLGVNTRDLHDAAAAFVVGRETYPSIFDPAGKVALSFAVPPQSIPSTIIIDRHGRIAAVVYGYALRDTLEPVVTRLAAESG